MKKTEKTNKTKRFKLFDMNRDGKGVYEQESRKPNLKFFFVLLFRKFTQLLQVNLLMLFMIIPILVVLGFYLLGAKSPSMTDPLFSALHGLSVISPSSPLVLGADLAGIQMELPVFSPAANVITIICAVFLAVTFGWQNVGAAYVIRGLFRGDPVFVFTDYFYAIKRNFKQAFFMGLLDFVFSVVLVVDFIFFYFRSGSFAMDFMYFVIFAISILYFVMRFYIYHLLVTFDISIGKILKNSLIFTVLGIKRNLMAILGMILFVGIHVFLALLLVPIGISLPFILPLVYAMAILTFITTYAAFPIIDRYMIEPYEHTNAVATTDESYENETL